MPSASDLTLKHGHVADSFFGEITEVIAPAVRSVPQQHAKKLLVVDDDVEFCSMLREFFAQSEFGLDCETDGLHAAARIQRETYDLLILDVMLPGANGFDLLRDIRQRSPLPIMMLTARNSRFDRVRGFDLGADDYLAKPFYPEELLARIRAILRRSANPLVGPKALRASDLVLCPGTRDAFFRGRQLRLTALESEILEQLLRSAGRAVSRDQVSIHLYNRPASPFDRTIDTHISRIRRKLGEGGNLIVSVRGTGYQLRCPPDQTKDERMNNARAANVDGCV